MKAVVMEPVRARRIGSCWETIPVKCTSNPTALRWPAGPIW